MLLPEYVVGVLQLAKGPRELLVAHAKLDPFETSAVPATIKRGLDPTKNCLTTKGSSRVPKGLKEVIGEMLCDEGLEKVPPPLIEVRRFSTTYTTAPCE